jgi:peroxiredoxin
MGVRLCRSSMFVDGGVVRALNIEAVGKFEVSSAEMLLQQIKALA